MQDVLEIDSENLKTHLSMEDSPPVFNKVVIAKVAIDRFESEISVSKSTLQADTA